MADVTGEQGQDDVCRLRGPGHGGLDQPEVGLVRHLLAVLVQLLEVLGVQRRQPLAGVLRLCAAQRGEVTLLVPPTLTS